MSEPARVVIPDEIDFITADEIFIKQIHLREKHTIVPQHSHHYAHSSMIARGAVLVWRDGVELGIFRAPQPILIEAGTKHTFMSLEPDTIIYCIHNISRTGEIQILEEHQLGE